MSGIVINLIKAIPKQNVSLNKKIKIVIKSVKFWDWLSKNYDGSAMDISYRLNLEKTAKHLNENDDMLDFACATGLYTVEFADSVSKIDALDISPKMIAHAEQKAMKNQIKNITFVCTTIFDEQYKKGSYDIILAFNILLYFKDVEQVLKRLHYLLKPGGKIITSTACLKEKRSFKAIFTTPIIFLLSRLRILPFIKFFKIEELEQFISDANFDAIET